MNLTITQTYPYKRQKILNNRKLTVEIQLQLTTYPDSQSAGEGELFDLASMMAFQLIQEINQNQQKQQQVQRFEAQKRRIVNMSQYALFFQPSVQNKQIFCLECQLFCQSAYQEQNVIYSASHLLYDPKRFVKKQTLIFTEIVTYKCRAQTLEFLKKQLLVLLQAYDSINLVKQKSQKYYNHVYVYV